MRARRKAIILATRLNPGSRHLQRPVGLRATLIALAILVAGLLAFILWRQWHAALPVPAEVPVPIDTPVAASPPAYVGSPACAGCHAAEHEAWQSSQHAVAMQVASEATVLGDFSGARLRQYGIETRFSRSVGKFMVRTDGPDGKLADFEVLHTFGVYPLQQYLVQLPGGRLQALSVAWDARPAAQGGQRWFHLYPNERIAHDDELHWTRRQQNWNYMCADCHSTNVQKKYDATSDSYATAWSEISVGCEACHGPGSTHVALARDAADRGRGMPSTGLTAALDERRGVTWSIDPGTGNSTRSTARATSRELDVCAQCHSRRGQFSNGYRPGEPFMDHYLPALLTQDLYHPDGQQREEVFDWGSFLSSRMHDKGVTCGDCHEPHGGRLRASGNAVCAQCHLATKYEQPGHHFHETGTAGAACASCHMPTTTYMVVDPRHDHSFRIPRPDLTESLGVPNACGACHADRSPAWAASEIRKRYPEPKPGFEGFAEAFAGADRGDPAASMALAQVAANQDESAIARASALDRLAQLPSESSALAAEAALDDPSPLVRMAAISVFEAMPVEQRRSLVPLLGDTVASVRMQAARMLAPVVDGSFDARESAAFTVAAAEFIAAQRFNADRPEHRTNLGGFLAERGDASAAEAEYRAALRLEPGFAPAWANLADLMRLLGREQAAEQTLRDGLLQAPRDASLHHALGLALVRQQRPAEALRELKRATELAPGNQRFAYVYGVARTELSTTAGPQAKP